VLAALTRHPSNAPCQWGKWGWGEANWV